MKRHINFRLFLLLFCFFQSACSKNMDLEWLGNSCALDAFMQCYSEFDVLNNFLREKYKNVDFKEDTDVLAKSCAMEKPEDFSDTKFAQRRAFIKKYFAKLYIELIDIIHDKGTEKENPENIVFLKKPLLPKDSKIPGRLSQSLNPKIPGYITQYEFLWNILVFEERLGGFAGVRAIGTGTDAVVMCCTFFNEVINSIQNQEIPGMVWQKSNGEFIVPVMAWQTKEQTWGLAKQNKPLFDISIITQGPIGESVEIENQIVINGVKYNLFGIVWSWVNDKHVWAYVKSKKDNCWYCYNSLSHKAKKITENDIEFSPKLRENKNMKPMALFYKMDELATSMIQLKNALQELKGKLRLLQGRLRNLQLRLGEVVLN